MYAIEVDPDSKNPKGALPRDIDHQKKVFGSSASFSFICRNILVFKIFFSFCYNANDTTRPLRRMWYLS
jgi:hypothetical protein